MWSAKRSLFTVIALTASALTIGTAAIAARPPAPQMPVPDRAVQVACESELADFLAGTPVPSPTNFAYTVDGRNSYWQAMATWWNAVPWDAVSGQWGCTTSDHSVTFNPPDSTGLITAGGGGISTCGGFILDDPSIVTQPETRTAMLQKNPNLLKQLGQ